MPGWQAFTKSDPAKPAPVVAKARKASSDPYGLERLAKSEAKTPRGMTQLAERIIEEGLPQPPALLPDNKAQGPSHAKQRCREIDPNAYRSRFPFDRVRSPREAKKRLREGWTDCKLVLPKLMLEGLRLMTVELACQQQNSDWPQERGRYPKTKNYHVAAALNAYLKKWGYEQFCLQERETTGRRVRRFVTPP
jgi:hypothetical protein